MTEIIKKNKTDVKRWPGRPKKEFTMKAIKKNEINVKRWRGRPKKEKKFEDSINTKISDHNKDIKKISKENEKMKFNFENTSFVSKKIEKENNRKSDNFALWLLIFSMLLFIFSLYKTFYLKNNDNSIDNIKNEINTEVFVETGVNSIEDVENNENEELVNKPLLVIENQDHEIIKNFYQTINDKKYTEIFDMVDVYLKNSNVFRTYYNTNWLSKFLWNLTNEKVYITNIKEKILEWQKNNVNYYTYTVKYKIKNNNELSQEERETAIVKKNGKSLIWSLQCKTNWCSKMPFFNPKR